MESIKRLAAWGVLTSLVMGLVVACGGGATFAGIDRLGVTAGTINGFGSIIVNGVEYDTDDATFEIKDASGNQSQLRVGQQVTISWDSLDNGVTRRARSVTYDRTLEGPIQNIDPVNQTLVVMGQVVIVDGATSFDDEIVPRDLSGLAEEDVVEISGLLDASGNVRATRIDFAENLDDFEVRGVVTGLDSLTSTFVINGLTVDYLDVLDPPANLADGDFVEVEGNSFDGTTLIATKVRIEDGGIAGADDGDDGEVEGYVSDFVSAGNFKVAGVPVATNGQTDFEGGVAGDLADNVKVEVEGEVNASGVLVARKLEFKSGDRDDDGDDDGIDGRVAGDVTAVTASTLTIAGVVVTVTPATRLEDKTGASGQSFRLADIVNGDYVEARGVPGTGAALTAEIVERDEASDEGVLRGGASAIDDVAFTLDVLGVAVATDGGTTYRSRDGGTLSRAAFFAAISTGTEVKVEFTQGGAIVADRLEIEDDLD